MSIQTANLIPIAKNEKQEIHLNLSLANRHGLIAGATGTGKTVTLQKLAQSFSLSGVPVFLSDIKGDLSGIGELGNENPKIRKRIDELNIKSFAFSKCPTIFWDVFGEKGHPLRATISDLGPLMLSRLLGLNDTQNDVLQVIFKIADDRGLEIIDIKDLQTLLRYISENKDLFVGQYGNIATPSIGAIQRSLLSLSQQGADQFFGEPMFNCLDLLKTDESGEGFIHLLHATRLIQSPQIYSLFLLWLLSELFENLPEVGDLEKPKLVFFFDEAHLLFKDSPKALTEKIENVVRLIRSKGVGIYFVTQNPLDIPETILGQLGNRYQHALRAFTPKDQKSVKVAAQTMRPNPEFKTEDAITVLAVGEALVSILNQDGSPAMTQKVFIIPPTTKIGPINPAVFDGLMAQSPYRGKYETPLERETAYEKISEILAKPISSGSELKKTVSGTREKPGLAEKMVQTATRTIAQELRRQVVRGILGGIFGGRR